MKSWFLLHFKKNMTGNLFCSAFTALPQVPEYLHRASEPEGVVQAWGWSFSGVNITSEDFLVGEPQQPE